MSSCIYGMETCPLRKSQFKSLDFVVKSALQKIFDTESHDIASRRWKFLEKITMSKNKLCNIFVVNDTKELSEIRLSYSDIMLNRNFSA